jgi:hypothetical protein
VIEDRRPSVAPTTSHHQRLCGSGCHNNAVALAFVGGSVDRGWEQRMHKFKVGQAVQFRPARVEQSAAARRPYLVTKQLPTHSPVGRD